MKRNLILTAVLLFTVSLAFAQNPLLHHHYSADPAPMVYGDRMYIYYDRDEGPSWYVMNEWRVMSSNDLVNWTDHGTVLPVTAFKWANIDSHSAWASQCIERNGKFYWYICVQYQGDWRHTIGVAVSDSPAGPFHDAIGKPLVPVIEGGQIDPTVFLDDDGQAYLYYGNNLLRYVKLNADMVSYDTSIGNNGIVTVPLTKEAFGGVKTDDGIDGVDAYEEGPWLSKHNGVYYLSYAAGGVPEHIAYSTSDSPTGPWTYRGQVMSLQSTNSFTNHSGYVDYKGKTYFAYHTGWLPGGGGYTRSTCLDEMHYNDDGTIQPITATHKGVSPVSTLDPYSQQEAETMNTSTGLWVYTQSNPRTIYVGDIDKNDTLRVRNVDFGTGAAALTVRVSSAYNSSYIDVHADKRAGTLIARVPVPYTGNDSTWQEVTVPIKNMVEGVHDILLVFNTSVATEKTAMMGYDQWRFTPKSEAHELVGINVEMAKIRIDTVAEYGNTTTFTAEAVYTDGTSEDITEQIEVQSSEELIAREGNTIKGIGYGDAQLTFSYNGKEATRLLRISSYYAENAVQSLQLDGTNVEDDVLTMLTGSTDNVAVTAVYGDGHTALVTSAASYSNDNTSVVKNLRGKLTAKADGDAHLTVKYRGALGDTCQAMLQVQVRTFPLKDSLMNVNIIGTGSFNEKTGLLKTTKDGLAGWQYASGLNLSAYKYIIVRLKRASTAKPVFRLYDLTDTESAYYACSLGVSKEAVIELSDLQKTDGTTLDLTNISVAGFSTSGGTVSISEVLLSNDGSTFVNIEEVDAGTDNAIYTLGGVATKHLTRGINLVKGKDGQYKKIIK